MKAADNIETRIERMRMTTLPATDERILRDAFSALESGVRSGSRETKADVSVIRAWLGAKAGWFAAAAAVIAIGVVLFWSARAGSPELRDVFTAVEKAQHVSIERYLGGDDEPVQRLWVSRPLRMKLVENTTGPRAGFVLLDGERGVRAYRQESSDLVSRHAISRDGVIGVRRSLTGSLGLVPFSDISLAGKGARWIRADESEAGGAEARAVGTDVDVYDLIWSEQDKGHRCRFYIDRETRFPKRVERYASKAGEEVERLEVVDSVVVTSEAEIENRIEYVFGPIVDARDVRPTPPEYIGTPEEY